MAYVIILKQNLTLCYVKQMSILLTVGYSYSGVKGDIKVWNPFVESDDEYSTSQISLKSGPYYDFESLESGWAVSTYTCNSYINRIYMDWTRSVNT